MARSKAPRPRLRLWSPPSRGATHRPCWWHRLSVASALAYALGLAPVAAEIVDAGYADPTRRYAHGVLGDTIEHATLVITDSQTGRHSIQLPPSRVFEDTAPRVIDATGDGAPDVVVVEAHKDKGARLAIYGTGGLIAATPYIGTPFRWLAPVAVGDLDGDGSVELAYVDRPHLAKTLRVWRFVEDGLREIASLPNVTNHRIGERDIAGGLRHCGSGPEMIVADGAWRDILAIRLSEGRLDKRVLGPHRGRNSFQHALACETLR